MLFSWVPQRTATPVTSSSTAFGEDEDEKASFLRNATPAAIRRHARDAGSGGLFMILFTLVNLVILSVTFALYTSMQVDLKSSTRQLEGSLFPGPNPSIARQKPNAAADVIWDELELTRTIVISADDVQKLGKDPSTAAKFDDEYWGLGDDAYMAQMDVFHQSRPLPDFSINHQCRDFNTLLEWRKEKSVDVEKWEAMKKPSGVLEVRAPAEFYEIFGEQGPRDIEVQRGTEDGVDP